MIKDYLICRNCKHNSIKKCCFCGKTKAEYKKTHRWLWERIEYLRLTMLKMIKFKMVTTRDNGTDEDIHYLFGRFNG